MPEMMPRMSPTAAIQIAITPQSGIFDASDDFFARGVKPGTPGGAGALGLRGVGAGTLGLKGAGAGALGLKDAGAGTLGLKGAGAGTPGLKGAGAGVLGLKGTGACVSHFVPSPNAQALLS